MRNLEALFSGPLFRALALALVHFIWQGALVAALYAGLNLLMRRLSAKARYALACAALLLMFVLPLATFYARFKATRGAGQRPILARASSGAAIPQKTLPAPDGSAETDEHEESLNVASGPKLFARWTTPSFDSLLPYLILCWLTGALLLSLRFAAGWFFAQRLRVRQTKPVTREWADNFARLTRRLRISRPVRLLESALVEVPTVVGWWRPVLLVPASLWTGLSAPQLEALLAHELAHIRRSDYLVNLLQAVVETLLFYHPAVWWISRRVRVEREHACDDVAVAATGDVLVYARALANLESARQLKRAPALTVAASGGQLMKRIQRLVIVQPSSTTFRSTLLAALLICATLAGTLVGASRLGSSVLANSRAASDEAKTDAPRRAVAVTFMGVPASFGYSDPMVERITGKLILSLNEHRIPAVGFVGASNLFDERNQVKEPRMKLLRMWLDAGLELGNQTYSHPSLYNIPLEQYEQETVRAEEVLNKLLSERGTKVRYFSYPFLNTGPNRETKERFEKFLTERGYTIHPVTIDNMDWLFSKVYAEAKRRDDEATMKRVAAEYVPYMESMFEFYEQLSRDVTGREVPQVLMLSASQLNADYFDEIVAMLQHRGYRFITLDEALKDEAYKQPDTYTGPVGISWLQRWAITRGAEFRTEPYLPPFMQQFDDKRRSGSDFKNKKS